MVSCCLDYAAIADGDPQILRLGPLNSNDHPGSSLVLPRELRLLRPAWCDLRHLQEAGEAMLTQV